MTNTVLKEQHLSQHILSCEECRVTSSLIVLTSPNSLVDDGLSINIVRYRSIVRHSMTDVKQRILGSNRTNMIFLNLVVRSVRTTITNEDSTSEFLVQHNPHLSPDPSNNVEVGDVNNIIAIEPLPLIDSLRLSCTLKKREDLISLLITLNITLGSCFILSNISKD